MIIQLVCGILIVEKQINVNINLIMIWQTVPAVRINQEATRYIIINLYNNQLINFYFSLYSCSWDKTVRCFDVETGKEIV